MALEEISWLHGRTDKNNFHHQKPKRKKASLIDETTTDYLTNPNLPPTQSND
jgi:hypothetical protein